MLFFPSIIHSWAVKAGIYVNRNYTDIHYKETNSNIVTSCGLCNKYMSLFISYGSENTQFLQARVKVNFSLLLNMWRGAICSQVLFLSCFSSVCTTKSSRTGRFSRQHSGFRRRRVRLVLAIHERPVLYIWVTSSTNTTFKFPTFHPPRILTMSVLRP